MNKILRLARSIDGKDIHGSDHVKELCFDIRVKTLRLLMEELLDGKRKITGIGHKNHEKRLFCDF